MRTQLSRPLSGLIDLVLPQRCGGCAAAGSGLCRRCCAEFGKLRRVHRPLIDEASLPAPAAAVTWANGPGSVLPAPPIYALGRYRGAARKAVLAYKERGRRELAEPFGRGIAIAIRPIAAELPETAPVDEATPLVASEYCLVPAPSRSAEARRRGGSHMARVARHAASTACEFGSTVTVLDCLRLRRGARDSVGLEPADRLRNVSGRVRLQGKPEPHGPVVLVDDVLTTGATVLTCLRVLHDHGVHVAAVVVLTAAG